MSISEEDVSADGAKELARQQRLSTKLAFYAWLSLLLTSLGTFVAGISGHIATLLAAPWLSFTTQAMIHASIPVFLTAVKIVTVPLLLLLTPFACHHPTFISWRNWGEAKVLQLEWALKGPWQFVKKTVRGARYTSPKSD